MPDRKVSSAFVKTITSFVIFRSCSVSDMERRFKDSQLVELQPGDTLYSHGETPGGVYLIESGSLKIVRMLSRENSITIRLANKRNLIGLESLFGNEKFQDTAIVIEKVRAYLLAKEAFMNLIFSNKTCYDGVVELMNKDLISARNRIMSLSQKRAKQRVAESIIWLSDFFGTDDDKEIRYNLKPGELATIAGTTLGNLNKLLTLFESMTFIDYKYNKLQVLEPKKLLQFANADLSNRLK